MKQWKLLLPLILIMSYIPAAMSASPAGTWTTVDDKTGQKRAVVRLEVNKGVLSGKIVSVYARSQDLGICSKCPGEFKNKPIKGLQFIWGLKEQENGVWSGGHILDAETGKIYKVKMTLKGKKLYVRGYVGVSLMGRTQVWIS